MRAANCSDKKRRSRGSNIVMRMVGCFVTLVTLPMISCLISVSFLIFYFS